jgi:hypothetical protein
MKYVPDCGMALLLHSSNILRLPFLCNRNGSNLK